MKIPLLALLCAASCTCAFSASRAVTPEETAAAWMLQAGLVRVTPMRVSAESMLTYMVKPQYPREMRVAGKPGYVKLEIAVDDDGNVIEAAVLVASRRPFAREALRAVSQWQFVPVEDPQPGGRRIVRVPIEFALTVPVR